MNATKGDDRSAQKQLFAGLAFSGQITASMTHELNNVLGTIEQVVGLIEDLSATDVVRQAGISDKLLDVVGRVTKQTDRGTTLIKNLNGFAHLSDNEVAECDLGDLVEQTVVLCARFAKMRKVQLVTVRPDQSIVIRSCPFQIVQAIFGGIKTALQIAEPPEPIQIGLGPCERGGLMTIDVRGDLKSGHAIGREATEEQSITRPDQTVESVGDGLHRIEVMLQGDA